LIGELSSNLLLLLLLLLSRRLLLLLRPLQNLGCKLSWHTSSRHAGVLGLTV
jgi:hypothetical protein